MQAGRENEMSGTKKFWTGVLWGALAGGAISLLDRDTRQAVAQSCKKTSGELSYYIKHPDEVVEQVKDATTKIRSTVEQVSGDISFIADKVEELREVTPAVKGIVKETKEVFQNEEE
jgi:gas vesicle protein